MAKSESKQLPPLTDQARDDALRCLDLADRLAARAFHRCSRAVPLDELQGVARLALICGAARFDAQLGVPFRAYAQRVIGHELLRAVLWWRSRDHLSFFHFSDLTPDAASGCSGCEPTCPWAAQSERRVADRELVDRLRLLLPARSFRLLRLRHVEGCSLKEIGRREGLSAERVRQLLDDALRRVRGSFPELVAD